MGATGYAHSGAGNINDTVNLPAGAAITYTINGIISPSATGILSDTASVSTLSDVVNTEANVNGSMTTNQSTYQATLTHIADVYVSLAGSDPLTVGGVDIYTIVVTNNGPSDANGVSLADTFSSLTGVAYTSAALYARTGSAPPTAGSASGTLSDANLALGESLNLPAHSVIEYTVTGTVAVGAPATLTDAVSADVPVGDFDPFTNNNTSSVSAAVVDGGGKVLGRSLFYGSSKFDGNNVNAATAPTTADFAAIATDKMPLLPGQTALFNNYSNYAKGINGLFVDLVGDTPGSIVASDFEFLVGNSSTPGTGSSPGTGWSLLTTAPAVTVFPGMGVDSSDRVALTWPKGAIQEQWLQVTVNANADTGLLAPDVFYFGSTIGDSGSSTTDAYVNAADEVSARGDPHNFLNPAIVTDPNDYSRDGFVNATDEVAARAFGTNFLTALKLISVPSLPNASRVSSTPLSLALPVQPDTVVSNALASPISPQKPMTVTVAPGHPASTPPAAVHARTKAKRLRPLILPPGRRASAPITQLSAEIPPPT